MSAAALRPGVLLGRYPMRSEPKESRLEKAVERMLELPADLMGRHDRRASRFIEAVDSREAEVRAYSPAQLDQAIARLRRGLTRHGLTDPLMALSFALIREVAGRTLGMRHFNSQLIGGWVMAQGMLAEMETGEGKTLTATLPAVTAALAGIPVHILTANDYLVQRDSAGMLPVYAGFGLTVGTVTEQMTAAERQASYARDVTYCTGKQVAFDHLKDRLVMGADSGRLSLGLESLYSDKTRADRLLLRGLCFAIVDEADNILIDEARTPLIISSEGRNTIQEETCRQALEIAARLRQNEDFALNIRDRAAQLTDQGEERIGRHAEELGGIWSGPRRRAELVIQALTAIHLFRRDKHYLVDGGRVQIIDEYTGRTMADRSWGQGLHQMIEVKEGCEVTAARETLARISFQRFFRRYLRLAGMTGTAREVAAELNSVYGLRVVRVPPNRPPQRQLAKDRVYRTLDAKEDAVLARIKEIHASGAPLLVGTRSVEDSERLSAILQFRGLPHRVLNARQNQDEAELVAAAGQRGRITIATNMAGRGTDIPLAPGSAELGGLHVIVTERHEARRIDRQLFGRCGRQGDPGRAECILSLDDDLLSCYLPGWLLRLAQGKGGRDAETGRIGRALIALAQRLAERRYRIARADLLRLDKRLEAEMGFAGSGE